MRNSSLTCLVLLVLSSFIANGQTNPYALPTLIPPSPEAAAFARYGEIPVDNSTGVPSISIPIYTIKSGKLELPITLSYHASGIKVRDIASTVGLGWVLNANGVISRTVVGYPDESITLQNHGNSPYPTQAQLDSVISTVPFNFGGGDNAVASTLDQIKANYYETQTDRYGYNVNGHSGTFRYDYLTDQVHTIPHRPIIIGRSITDGKASFRIVDESGFIYRFDTTEYSSNSGGGAVSTWMLNKMITPDSSDEIDFYYSNGDEIYEPSSSQTMVSGDNYTTGHSNESPTYNFSFLETRFINHHVTKRLDSILGRNIVVQFIYLSDRSDARATRISQIKILNRSDRSVIQQASFFQSYFGSQSSNSLRLRFDSIQVSGSDVNAASMKYSFKYNSTIPVPAYYSLSYVPNEGFWEDYWGYFNGGAGASQIPAEFMTFLPSGYSSYQATYGGNLNPNPNYMQTCILNEIKWPLGGKTLFEFEPNQSAGAFYGYTNSNNGIIGGLRVKSIRNIAGANLTDTIYKSYAYNNIGAVNGVQSNLYTFQQQYVYLYHDIGSGYDDAQHFVSKYVAQSSPLYPLTVLSQSPIIYSKVTEFNGRDSVSNTGKTEYVYDMPLNYNYVSQDIDRPRLLSQFPNDRGDYEARLLHKKEYKNTGGSFQLVTSSNNKYYHQGRLTFNTGFKIDRTTTYISTAIFKPYLSAYDYVHEFIYADTKAYTDIDLLVQSDDTTFASDGSGRYICRSTSTQFDSLTLLPIVKKELTSKGDTLKTIHRYTSDFSAQTPYNSMVAKNIFTPIVEQQKYINGSFLEKTHTSYKDWGNNLYAPETVSSQKGNRAEEVRVRFYRYDNRGNPVTVGKQSDKKVSYIWDYQGYYPIAEVQNADSAAIAFTSFEADGTGNWYVPSSLRNTTAAVTGTKSYSLDNGTISAFDLVSGQYYIVSYWSNNGHKTMGGVTGNTIRTGRTVNGWTYYEHTIRATTLPLHVNGTGLIDELRLYPVGGFMTSYTYHPSIGIASVSDANGEIAYYEYDNLNRLENIRDYLGNIVKNFQYNYSNSCGDNCFVLPMQTFLGSNTLSYPVGVFNINGKLLGNAANQTSYIALWMGDTANSHIGTLTAGADSMHFRLALSTGKNPPAALTGCRYYQYEVADTLFDAVRNMNGAYVDFGDGYGMALGSSYADTPSYICPNTTVHTSTGVNYYVHKYADSTNKVIRFYHNDAAELPFIWSYSYYNTLNKVRNVKGYFPQFLSELDADWATDTTAVSLDSVYNWNTINSVQYFLSDIRRYHYPQDFMRNNKGLTGIVIYDSTKLSRLKSDWNTYFKNLTDLYCNSISWNNEDLSALTQLNNIWFTDSPSWGAVLTTSQIDAIINQVAAGAGQNIISGTLFINTWGAGSRTSASDAAVSLLTTKGWYLYVPAKN